MGGLSLIIQLVLGYVAAVGALRAARVMQVRVVTFVAAAVRHLCGLPN